LTALQWDAGNEHFQPTTWQVSNVHGGTGALNVIPGSLQLDFNFRFSTASTERSLKERLEAVLKRHGVDYAIEWTLGAKPFITSRGRLVEVVSTVIKKHTGRAPELSTTGGTSDARFIAEVCPQVVELGPVNSSIHKLDEHIELGALEQLPKIYLDTLRALLP
jgi:succinyl-diaminopimelate desuccinylase